MPIIKNVLKEENDFMKNLLHKKRIFTKTSFLLLAFSFAVITSCSDHEVMLRGDPGLTQKCILTGTFSDTTDIFDYYDIGNNEYAVALNGNYKTSYTQTINIPETHLNKKVTGIWRNANFKRQKKQWQEQILTNYCRLAVTLAT